jgi:hypothetical protein
MREDTRHAALAAIASGRVPADEALVSRLRRRGLVQRNVLDRGYHLTPRGSAALHAAEHAEAGEIPVPVRAVSGPVRFF